MKREKSKKNYRTNNNKNYYQSNNYQNTSKVGITGHTIKTKNKEALIIGKTLIIITKKIYHNNKNRTILEKNIHIIKILI